MAGYMILYICIVKALLISVVQPACIGSKCLDEVDGDGPCTKDGLCDDKEVDLEKRQKRDSEAQYAYYVEFQIRLSESLVSVLKSEQILLRLEEYLQQSTGVNPQDIFNLTMFSNPDEKLLSRYIVSFILQPETKDVNWIRNRIETLVNLETGIQLIGMPVYMHRNTFVNSTTLWDGINTIIRFKLMVEYEWLEHNGIADSNNLIATFLHERFQIALRDMYDLTLMDTTGGKTTVFFSLPPIMTIDRSSLLADVQSFVDSPCEDTCKQSGSTIGMDECTSCEFVSLFETNVYLDQHSFQTFQGTWTGSEKRFAMANSEWKPCPDHQEMCINGQCIGIGRCDKYFYKTVHASIEVYGSIQLLDMYGLDVAIVTIGDSIADSHGFCRSAVHVELFDHGRTKLGMGLRIEPSTGRTASLENLVDTIEQNDHVEVVDLVVSKVENSFSVKYLEPHKPIPKYIDNDCFGCSKEEVWCILPNISLCLSKQDCQETQARMMKFADDTEIVSVSILMSSKAEFVDITEDFKEIIKQQIAIQLYCSMELLTNVYMVPSEPKLFELGFEIVLLDNNKELKDLVIFLQRITDREELKIKTNEVQFTAVSESLIYKQLISGYLKHKKDKISSSHLGDAITGGSFLSLLFLVITILVKAVRKLQNRPVYQTPSDTETFKFEEKTPKRRSHVRGILSRN